MKIERLRACTRPESSDVQSVTVRLSVIFLVDVWRPLVDANPDTSAKDFLWGELVE